MGAPQIKNQNVGRAINTLTVYRNILILMAQDEKDYANQLNLKFMIELNSRLIHFLNTIAESEVSMDQLPEILRVKPENIKEFFIKLNREISSYNSQLVHFSRSQSTQWEFFFDSLLEIPDDMLSCEPFTNGMIAAVVGCLSSSLAAIGAALLAGTPELIVPSLTILFPMYICLAFSVSLTVAFTYALIEFYNNIAPTYQRDGFTALSNKQLLALNELVNLTQQDEFTAAIPNTPFEEVAITQQTYKVSQAFFAKRTSSDSRTLADEAAHRYDTVRNNMYI